MTQEIDDPIAALRTELERVAPSSGFADRVRERLADELQPLRAELTDLTVSAEFAVRVRQSIEAGGSRKRLSWPPFTRRFVVPAAGLAAGVMAGLIYLTSVDSPPPVQSATSTVVMPMVETPKSAPIAPVRESAAPAIRAARVIDNRTASNAPRDPMLEVITDQPAVLRALWVRVEPGVTVDSTEPDAPYQAPKIEVAPIEVSPISKFVVPDTRAPIGVTPIILRFGSVGTPAPHLLDRWGPLHPTFWIGGDPCTPTL
jgi:hypothetical protein